MRVVFSEVAAAELDSALAWYDDERVGLGDELLSEAARVVSAIVDSPLRYRVVHNQLRRAVLERFPYSVLYRVSADEILVEAFFHGSRDPQCWIERDQ